MRIDNETVRQKNRYRQREIEKWGERERASLMMEN